MATYTKPRIAIGITTIMNSTFSGGASALEGLKAHKTISTKGGDDGEAALIPFHAVKKYDVNVDTIDATKADAYCE